MSDSGNSFGEALESMTTNTKKAIGGTIADFTKSATNQVKGTGGITTQPQSGSFNPNSLQGGDLFSPDMIKQSQNSNIKSQNPVTQAQQVIQSDVKSPEDLQKIQSIEAELATLKQAKHSEYYQDFLRKAEGRDRNKQAEVKQAEDQDEQVKKMDDLQKKQQQDQDVQKFRAARGTELAKGNQG